MSEEAGPGNYIIHYLAAYEALRRAAAQAFDMSQNMALPMDARARAGALSEDLGTQLLQLKFAHEAFMKRFDIVSPPGPQVITEAIEHARRLAALLSGSLLAQGLLEAVIGIVDAWNGLALKPAPSTAPGAGPTGAPQGAVPEPTKPDAIALTRTHWLRGVTAALAAKP